MSFGFDVRYSEEHRGMRSQNAVREWLNAFRDTIAQPAPAMREIGEALVASTKRRFNIEMSPQDGRWARNSPVTIASKGHAKPLKGKTGRLRESIQYHLQGSGKAISIGSDLPYAAMQQFGGARARFPHLWGDIPSRPFIGLSQRDRERVNAIILQYLGRV